MEEKLDYRRADLTSVLAVVLQIISHRHFTPSATEDNLSSDDTSSFLSIAPVKLVFQLQGLLLPRATS